MSTRPESEGGVWVSTEAIYRLLQKVDRRIDRLTVDVEHLKSTGGKVTPTVAWSAAVAAYGDVLYRFLAGG